MFVGSLVSIAPKIMILPSRMLVGKKIMKCSTVVGTTELDDLITEYNEIKTEYNERNTE